MGTTQVTKVLALVCVAMMASSAWAENGTPKRVTWANDIVPIMQENCQGCHRPGQIGPFSLVNYEDARPWVKSIKKEVVVRSMPPYSADPSSMAMRGDMNLEKAEIDAIVAWVDQGAPMGDPADLPAPKVFEQFEGGWQLGIPDIVLEPLEPFEVSKEADDLYQCFPVPLGLDHDIWIKGAEFQPDNSLVVHHFILFEDIRSRFDEYDAETPEPGCECEDMEKVLMGTKVVKMWAPGNVQPLSPEGLGQKISAGSNLILQVHYHNVTGEDQIDQSKFGLHLAQPSETMMKEFQGQMVVQPRLNILAGDPESRHEASYTTKRPITIYSTGVHMHLRGKSMGMWAKRPGDVDETTIIWVPNFDFNWQLSYEFTEPWKVPTGTTFTMRCVHDNSANNPNNPDPTKDIHWGLYSSDEMAFSGYSYTVDDEALNVTPWVPSEDVLASLPAAVDATP